MSSFYFLKTDRAGINSVVGRTKGSVNKAQKKASLEVKGLFGKRITNSSGWAHMDGLKWKQKEKKNLVYFQKATPCFLDSRRSWSCASYLWKRRSSGDVFNKYSFGDYKNSMEPPTKFRVQSLPMLPRKKKKKKSPKTKVAAASRTTVCNHTHLLLQLHCLYF